MKTQLPTLLEFIQKYRPDVREILGPDERGLFEFKGFILKGIQQERIEYEDETTGEMIEKIIVREVEIEIPLENLGELYGLIPLYRPFVERQQLFK